MTRRELREHVFMLLFLSEYHPPEEMEEQLSFYFEGMTLPDETEPETRYKLLLTPEGADAEQVKARFQGVVSHKTEIDEILSASTSGWKLDRLGKVELMLLRLAVFEMKFDEDIPDKVAINEAVELAKKYGSDASSGFINGVLAKLAKQED